MIDETISFLSFFLSFFSFSFSFFFLLLQANLARACNIFLVVQLLCDGLWKCKKRVSSLAESNTS
jgi:hypothetical protein